MKKYCIILWALFLICSCSIKQSEKVIKPQPQIIKPPAMLSDKPVLSEKKIIKPLYGELLSDVNLQKSSFNPNHNQKVTLSYSLAKPARVKINVFDPDNGLVLTFSENKIIESGKKEFVWDGKDLAGNIVPDEAYFFTISAKDESGNKEIYDPTTFSGGVSHDITDVHIDPHSYTINYTMAEMGRVMIRMGTQGGPCLQQLVDWKPRTKGSVTEYWNGKDKDNVVDIIQNPDFKMFVTYFSFPENSVITYGNKSLNFREYKKTVAQKREKKISRKALIEGISHHYHIPRTIDYSPTIKVEFTNVKGTDKNGVPILSKKSIVKVEIDNEDKIIFQNYQFEVCFFLDYKFYAEDETGFTPFNWVWNLSDVEEGEHLFTVNITSFKDQIGLFSKKIKVVR